MGNKGSSYLKVLTVNMGTRSIRNKKKKKEEEKPGQEEEEEEEEEEEAEEEEAEEEEAKEEEEEEEKGKKGKEQKEDKRGWTKFRREYLNTILKKDKPHIVLVQEGVPNLLDDVQNKMYDIFPPSEPGKSSLIQIIIRKDFEFEEIEDIPNGIKDRVKAIIITYEGLSITCVSVHGKNLIGKSSKKELQKETETDLLEFLQYLDMQRKKLFRPIIIGGDFNIDVDHFKTIAERIDDSSLSVVHDTASERGSRSYDYDFFIKSKEVKAYCKKQRRNIYYPKNDILSKKNIIDHSPTRITASLKPLKGIIAKGNVNSWIEDGIQTLKETTNTLESRLNALIKERKDHYSKICSALESCDDVDFEVVDPYLDNFLTKHERKVEENNLDKFKSIIMIYDENEALEKDIKFLTEMQFAVKAPTSGQNHG